MADFLKLRSAFADLSLDAPRLFSAPGRVNLIGEHTDYNQGFVLPLAANLRTYVAAGSRNDGQVCVHSVDLNETASFTLDVSDERRSETQSRNWVKYIQGVTQTLIARGLNFSGANLAIISDVPIGAGLSSSAALEISVGFALAEISGMKITRLDLARAAQEAEHVFVGTNSGLMDQLTATFAEKDRAMLLDCRSLEIKQIPIDLPNTAIAICDTRIKHDLASSAYNERRRECERAVQLLRKRKPEVNSLRDLEIDDLGLVEDLPEPERSRARHVITENNRTVRAARALEARDVSQLGRLLVQSHESLRDDYQVSCSELDVTVELSLQQNGVAGARMMGGGFGGCTINLVDREQLELFTQRITTSYQDRTGMVPLIIVVEADEGVCEMTD